MLEGELWKWTNYWNGWQSRWFILEGGILSYFKSVEEVDQGCKGAINIAACDIHIHPHDTLRLEISIPGEQYLYLRANSEKDRQQWIIALGSAKACLTPLDNDDANGHTRSNSASSSTSETIDQLKTKKSELRLYCDLLTQQVHNLKVASDGNEPLLSETCDTFIKTLDQVMELSLSATNESQPTQPSTTSRISESFNNKVKRRSRMGSEFSLGGISEGSSPPPNVTSNGFHSLFGTNSKSAADPIEPVRTSDVGTNTDDIEFPMFSMMRIENLLKYPFTDLDMNHPNRISTKQFIASSKSAIKIFDYLESNSFSPIKIDIEGHIKCLSTKYQCDPKTYDHLQEIVITEIKEGVASSTASGSHALLWLVRSLMFIHNFLRRFIESNDSVAEALTVAYETTLKLHHDWVVRNVFSVALKSCPSRLEFLESLGLPPMTETIGDENQKRIFQTQFFPILAKYLDSMEKTLMVLTQFYQTIQIDADQST